MTRRVSLKDCEPFPVLNLASKPSTERMVGQRAFWPMIFHAIDANTVMIKTDVFAKIHYVVSARKIARPNESLSSDRT